MTILIFFIISYILLSISLYKVFEKAGEEGWKGLVPGLNFVVWAKIIGQPTWHAALLLIPIVNIFIYAGMCVDMVRSFGKYELWHSAIAVIYAPLIFFYLGFSDKEQYDGPTIIKEKEYAEALQSAQENNEARKLRKLQQNNPYRKSAAREWVEAIVFAVFAAAFIRMFLIEAYVIPTPSMEGSLLVGDFLFVSKAHYGIRTPQTVAMIPLLHNQIPKIGGESYLKSPSLPYYRLPALEEIDRNDPVVFNYPEGDSVYVFPDRTWSIHDLRRGAIPPQYVQMINSGKKKLTVRPMDKKDHYIKRCVAIPGDSIQIKDRQLYINGQPAENPSHVQFAYTVRFPAGMNLNTKKFAEWGVVESDIFRTPDGVLHFMMSDEQKEKVQSMNKDIVIQPIDIRILGGEDPNKAFPHDAKNFPNQTIDNFGPLWVPQKGATVKITPNSIAPYRRIIDVYENNDLQIKGNKILINGQETDSYTFKMNYYWMMGDNRHNSEDSRIWGFVPEDHIVGKPLFIWMHWGEQPFYKRMFTSANKK